MTIEEQVSKGIMAAMKAKDTVRLEVLRNIKKVFIEAKSVAGAPDQIADSESVKIIQKLANRLKYIKVREEKICILMRWRRLRC